MADFMIELTRPIQVGSETVSTLECNEPTLADLDAFMRAQRESDVAAIMKLVQRCAGLAPSLVEKIKAVDLKLIMDSFLPFLPKDSEPAE